MVAVAVAAVGLVVDQLLRLKRWLNRPPAGHDLREPPDDEQ